MPAFTAVALDRLIEPGGSNSMLPPRNPPNSNLRRRNSTPITSRDREIDFASSKLERGVSIPFNTKLNCGNNSSSTKTASSVRTDVKHHWTQISPALYATPESTPLPDSPSSFPPSPYIINHKRRGPRLNKSFSEDDVATWKHDTNEIKVDGNGHTDQNGVAASVSKDDNVISVKVQELHVGDEGMHSNGASNNDENCPADQNGVMKSINTREDGEGDAFVDPQDSMSVKCESEGNGGAEMSLNLTTPFAEFYDAWEELASESPQLQNLDIESELHEMRLSLLMEIEKRKQAEEKLHNMRNQWQIIHEKLSLVGLTLPEDPTALPDGEQPDDYAENLWQQVYLARFVSHSIGRGIGKAEVEMEMEAQIKMKDIEIARLWDRLHYYEAVNQEMSQRNQQVMETTRRLRQRRKRRQKWVWGSIAAAVTLGSAVLAYSYFYSGKTSLSSTQSRLTHTPKVDCDAK